MSLAPDTSMSHIAVRFSLSELETMERAAALQELFLNDFLITAAQDTAETVIAGQMITDQTLVRLAPGQHTLAAALLAEETEEPSSFLERLSAEYDQRVESR